MYSINSLAFMINEENVTFYGYRKASPGMYLVSFDREDKKIKRLEERLYEITKATRDNHVLFEVKVDEYTLALQFTDMKMWLGLGVEKHSW